MVHKLVWEDRKINFESFDEKVRGLCHLGGIHRSEVKIRKVSRSKNVLKIIRDVYLVYIIFHQVSVFSSGINLSPMKIICPIKQNETDFTKEISTKSSFKKFSTKCV